MKKYARFLLAVGILVLLGCTSNTHVQAKIHAAFDEHIIKEVPTPESKYEATSTATIVSTPTPRTTVAKSPTPKTTKSSTATPSVTKSPTAKPTPAEPSSTSIDYVLNKNTKKFHYPWCSSVKQIKSSNRLDYTGSREKVISMGYQPCKKCNP